LTEYSFEDILFIGGAKVKIMISDNIIGISAENFVIKIFDAIKCAAGTGNALDIKLNHQEVDVLAEHIKNVNWIEINEGSVK
jgi:hypothetical protein